MGARGHQWFLPLDDQRRELAPLMDLMRNRNDWQPIRPFYESLVAGLAQDPSPEIDVVQSDTHYAPADHRIVLGLLDRGDRNEHGLERWLEVVHASFWHEFGHSQYSRKLDAGSNDERMELAANLLEDLRMERRLLANFGERARSWIRFNLLSDKDIASIPRFAANDGWEVVTTVIAGRGVAGVLTADEVEAIRSLDGEAAQAIKDLGPVWEDYVALADDEIAPPAITPLASALAPHVPRHWFA